MKYRLTSIGPNYSLNLFEPPASTISEFQADTDQEAVNYSEWLLEEKLRFITDDGPKRGRPEELIELNDPPRVIKRW